MSNNGSRRWESTEQCDIDAFELGGGNWMLFASIKDESLPLSYGFWIEKARRFSDGPVGFVSRAFKTISRSEPLPAVPVTFEEVPGEVWALERHGVDCLKLRLETNGVLNPGLFLDQSANRYQLMRLIKANPGGHFLNLFSYTGAFSIAALAAGAAATTSVDVSARYLAWEKKNFDEAGFGASGRRQKLICDDARHFLKGAAKRGDRYASIVIDPPTFSRGSKGTPKPFRARDELQALVESARECLEPKGVILASCNDSRWSAAEFQRDVSSWARALGLRFREGEKARGFPPHHPLKSAWLGGV